MGPYAARRQASHCPPVMCIPTPVVCAPSVSFSPAAPEAPLENNPPPWMKVSAEKTKEANCHGDTLTIVLPKDKNPAFLYHGRMRSDFASGTGESVVSRNSKGLTFDPGDIGVADSCMQVRRRELTLADGSMGYQYTVEFRKETASNAGARDPGKLAIRIDGKEFAAIAEQSFPQMTPSAPPSFDLSIPPPRLLPSASKAIDAAIPQPPTIAPPLKAKLQASKETDSKIKKPYPKPQGGSDRNPFEDFFGPESGVPKLQPPVPVPPVAPMPTPKGDAGMEKGVAIEDDKLNAALDKLVERLESKCKEAEVTGVTFYATAANTADTFHYLAATYDSQSKKLFISGFERSSSNSQEERTDQLTLVKGSSGKWRLGMVRNSREGKILAVSRELEPDEVKLTVEAKSGGVNLPLRTAWLNTLDLSSIRPTWAGRPVDCDSW